MPRTKLKDRCLPDYTRGEEIFNMVSHIVGGAFGIVALVVCVWISVRRRDPNALAGGIIYGVSMILLYTMSSIYHGLIPHTAKKVFQILDHCTIYLLIAGTYTPILLSMVRPLDPLVGWVFFAVIWSLSVLGIVLNAIDLKQFRVVSMILYMGIGWSVIFASPVLIAEYGLRGIAGITGRGGLACLIGGGLAYTIGAIFYGCGKRKRYIHSIWHLFVLAGSILHFVFIAFYVL